MKNLKQKGEKNLSSKERTEFRQYFLEAFKAVYEGQMVLGVDVRDFGTEKGPEETWINGTVSK